MAEAEVAAFKLYQHDSAGVRPNFAGLAEAMGAKLRFPERDRPQLAEPAIHSYGSH